MGAQWKHSGRVANADKRGRVFGKLCKEIVVAAKLGDPNPEGNARLRAALEAARKMSVPKDTIDRAVKKGAGLLDGDNVQFEIVTYEGFTPHKVPIIVECLTDNKNRTASDIRVAFRKAQLGSMGAVAWMFDRLGIIEATHEDQNQDPEEAAIEAGAQNVETIDASEDEENKKGARFFSDPADLDVVNKELTSRGWKISKSELGYVPKNLVEVSAEQKKEIEEFLVGVDDYDDVHRIYVALK